jgi:serine/threonine-protein kinase
MMNQPANSIRPPDLRLQEIITAYQAARRAGQAPAPQELLDRYPDLAEPLRAFLATQETTRSFEIRATPNPTPPTGAGEAPTLALPGTTSATPALCGQDFGDYEVLEEIARGGMGVVYKARQKSLNRVVALKMILAGQLASVEQVRRFRIEAEQGGGLDHPNIVPIYQIGEVGGQHYFTMKLIEGGSLSDQIARWKDDVRGAAKLVAAVARAVHYAHQHGILHRDLKPGNILLDAEGRPHVTDFGLAKHLEGNQASTVSGAIVGTPSYMAPEQVAARKHLSTAADVYSLGAVLYELVTGRPPFQAATPFDVFQQVLEQEPARPRSLNLKVDRDLETICLTCLAKEPERRYASAEALARDLERYLAGEPIRARPAGVRERVFKWVRRRPAAAALLVVIGLAVLGLSLGGWWVNVLLQAALRDASRARQAAEDRQQEAERERQEAEDRRQEAERERQRAEANAKEADRQRELVKTNFQKRLQIVDDFLLRMDRRLANMEEMEGVRIEFLSEALQLCEGLLKERVNDPAVRRQTGRVYGSLGDAWRERGSIQKAEEAYDQALALQKKLVEESAGEPAYRNDLIITQSNRAKLLQARQRFAEAEEIYRQIIPLQDQLAAEFPNEPDYLSEAARYRFELGNLLEESRNARQAERFYREALAKVEKLAAKHPDRPDYQAEQGQAATSLALFLNDSQPDEAHRLLEESLKAHQQAHRLVPNSKEYHRRLQDCYHDLEDFLRQHHKHQELAQLAERQRQDFADNPQDTFRAAGYLAEAAELVQETRGLTAKQRAKRVDDYGKQAVALLDKALKEGYSNREQLEKDPTLNPLRERPDFQKLLADLDKRLPPQAFTPARAYTALVGEHEKAEYWYHYYLRRAQTVAGKKKAQARKPRIEEYVERALDLADKYRDSSTAVEALAWILDKSGDSEGPPVPAELVEKALERLQRDHLHKPELAQVCQRLAKNPVPEGDALLRAIQEKHDQQTVRGLAAYALALSLAKQAEDMQKVNTREAEKLSQKAEQQMAKVVSQYATLPYGRTTLGETAKAKLYEIQHLSVGRPAPDTEGEDLDGQKFKLSDYRGKVVVIDFWADWCGWCRRLYPLEKQLVEKLKGQPFALLGVNGDNDRAEARRAVQKEGLTWRSWWDGGQGSGHIFEQWHVHGFPRLFILDGAGVIRYKDVRGEELEGKIGLLLVEENAKRNAEKK